MSKTIVLERVILKNFNSFQNDEVPLNNGLTIITGPNGAGKSTVFQGIKFAMGSNERGDRSSKWSNFIRIGEKIGSVEIHIRVDDELYKIRRVIYDDQTPYFQIMEPGKEKFRNTTASKIHDLITDLKFNPDNVFAFVSQGDVNNIRKMKIMEIREFLEIGLGLHDLREKIQERKQEISEMDKQIKSLDTQKDNASYELEVLKPQLKRLEEKRELEKKKDLLEKEKLWLNRNKLKHDIDIISKNIEKSYEERKKAESSKLHEEQELSTISNNIDIKTENIEKLINQISTLSAEEKILNGKINEWQDGKDTLAQDILNTENKLKKLDNDLKKNTNDFDIIHQEVEKYRFEHGIAIGELKKIRDERSKNEKIREKNKDILTNLENLTNKKTEYENNIKNHKSSISQIEKQISNYMDEIKSINQEIEKFKWFSKKPEENTSVLLEQKKEKIEIVLEKLNLKIDRLQEQNKRFEFQIEKLKTATLMKEVPKSREIQNLIREIKERNLDVTGPIIDNIQFNPKIGNAVDAILSKYVLNSFIVKNKSDFLLLQSLIKQTRAKCNVYQPLDKNIIPNKPLKVDREQGIIGYLADLIKPLGYNKDVEKVIRSICRNTILVRDKSIGYDFIKEGSQNYKGKIVTLDGTVLRTYDYVMESRASESRGEEYKNPIEQKEKLDEMLINLTENRKLLDNTIGKRDELKKREKIVLARLKYIDSLEASYRKMTIISEQKQKFLEQKKNIIKEKNQFNENLRDIEQQLNELKRNLPKNLDEINKFFENFQKRSEELEEKITLLSNSLLNKEMERNKYEFKIEKIKEELEDSISKLSGMKLELKSKNNEILEMIHRITDLKEEITSLNEDQNECKKEINVLKESKKITEDKLIEIKTHISEIEIKIENFMAEKYQKEQLLNEIKLDFSDIETNYVERSIQEVENDLKIVYEKLREYYDVSEDILSRKQYLESKIQKIIGKKQKLHQEIEEAKITEEKLEREFRTRFEENLSLIETNINKRFQNAGIRREGKLELVGDLDNLGVEIYVKFNAGIERQISSLSGGEQTMFAISLMLTLQNLHPSPLCIFDEAQMFLDKENSHEVAKLIKNATHKGIQFVILVPDATKTLLELADSVIGIAKNGKQDVSTVLEIPQTTFNK